MGLIDFILDAGTSLFSGGEPTAEEKAEKLKETVNNFGLGASGLSVVVDGVKAILSGEVSSQEEKEKLIVAIGNTEGIGQVEDNFTVASPEPEAVYYTVQKGDTLSAISKAQYGDANKYQAIFEANKPMLEHPDKIYPGQVLRIPPQ